MLTVDSLVIIPLSLALLYHCLLLCLGVSHCILLSDVPAWLEHQQSLSLGLRLWLNSNKFQIYMEISYGTIQLYNSFSHYIVGKILTHSMIQLYLLFMDSFKPQCQMGLVCDQNAYLSEYITLPHQFQSDSSYSVQNSWNPWILVDFFLYVCSFPM